jgi:hypothetical protein
MIVNPKRCHYYFFTAGYMDECKIRPSGIHVDDSMLLVVCKSAKKNEMVLERVIE